MTTLSKKTPVTSKATYQIDANSQQLASIATVAAQLATMPVAAVETDPVPTTPAPAPIIPMTPVPSVASGMPVANEGDIMTDSDGNSFQYKDETWFPITLQLPSNPSNSANQPTQLTEDEKRKRTIIIASVLLLLLLLAVAFFSFRKA